MRTANQHVSQYVPINLASNCFRCCVNPQAPLTDRTNPTSRVQNMEHFATTAIDLLLATVAAEPQQESLLETVATSCQEPAPRDSQHPTSRPKGDLG
jgi:hypothetical protein